MLNESYIDKLKIIDKLNAHKTFLMNAYNSFDKLPLDLKIRCDEIDNCIAEIVNEKEVEIVKHGRWIKDENDFYFRCSTCGECCPIDCNWDEILSNYCPNCGSHNKRE